MVITEKRVRKQALKLSAAAAVFLGLGAFAMAAPFAFSTTTYVVGAGPAPHAVKLTPLGSGPAIQLASAGEGFGEDCVRVTRITGPGSKVTPVRGFVCDGKP